MDWQQLLSDHRMPYDDRPARASEPERYRSAFEADYDRVVYSAAFRRLARKTQVHPMATNDHVHNRLTHSIEVASVGRSFARRLGDFLMRQGKLQARNIEDLCQILQAACLVHDIGNPPFGHAGEFAIREWVRTHKTLVFQAPGCAVPEAMQADLLAFEGNAQGFRLAARTDLKGDFMRLTWATLGAMIKYPWTSMDPRAEATSKFNVFSSEVGLFRQMVEGLGMVGPSGEAARHPLSFLSEAADDICYRILDLEDAVQLNILNEAQVRDLLLDLLPGEKSQPDRDRPLGYLRGQVIKLLVDECWAVFEKDYASIMAGTRSHDLKQCLPEATRTFLTRVSELYATIFATRNKVATELGAYQTLGRILEVLIQAIQALSLKGDHESVDFLNRRRLELAWGREYTIRHATQSYDWWLRQVMDYVSGLTDNYARQLSREIAGV
ncbi:MAG: dNTP triphosphohydrolase [Phycisphaeraceae bacterium]|nr:dNTP triphosphohydrolase [Phycisphaeraceae bacterium]